MKKYNTIIFDMDGTLLDTSEGIIKCYNYTARKMGVNELPNDRFRYIIGSPLLYGFQEHYGLDEDKAKVAVEIYRERYKEKGIYEACIYEGIEELLKWLKDNSFKVGIATLKLDSFAKKMIEHFNLGEYFQVIQGIDEKDHLTKSQMVNICLKELQVEDKSKAILIGDSLYDAIGAKESGIDFIGVTYGWGFKNLEDVNKHNNILSAESPYQIIDFLSDNI